MNNIKNDEYYISKIKEHLNFICNHMSKIDKDNFNKDEILQKAMSFSLVQISEDSKNLSDEYKTNHNQIPWTDIYGLRNRIVHDYGNVDLTIIFETLKNDIPEVLKLIQ